MLFIVLAVEVSRVKTQLEDVSCSNVLIDRLQLAHFSNKGVIKTRVSSGRSGTVIILLFVISDVTVHESASGHPARRDTRLDFQVNLGSWGRFPSNLYVPVG